MYLFNRDFLWKASSFNSWYWVLTAEFWGGFFVFFSFLFYFFLPAKCWHKWLVDWVWLAGVFHITPSIRNIYFCYEIMGVLCTFHNYLTYLGNAIKYFFAFIFPWSSFFFYLSFQWNDQYIQNWTHVKGVWIHMSRSLQMPHFSCCEREWAYQADSSISGLLLVLSKVWYSFNSYYLFCHLNLLCWVKAKWLCASL